MPLIDSEKNLDDMELSIVIPAYNEEKRLFKTIGKIIDVIFYLLLNNKNLSVNNDSCILNNLNNFF